MILNRGVFRDDFRKSCFKKTKALLYSRIEAFLKPFPPLLLLENTFVTISWVSRFLMGVFSPFASPPRGVRAAASPALLLMNHVSPEGSRICNSLPAANFWRGFQSKEGSIR